METRNIQDSLSVVDRLDAPTPKFFKTIRRIGVILGVIGGAILASPVALPAALVAGAGYLIAIGTAATAVSSLTVDFEKLKAEED